MAIMHGTISVKQDGATYTVNVYAQDDASLKLYLTCINEQDINKQKQICTMWDTPTMRKSKNVEHVDGDYWRRIDIGSTAKYKTNIPNNEYSSKIAVALRYLRLYGKFVDTVTGLVPLQTGSVSGADAKRRYRLIADKCNDYNITGEYYTQNGSMCEIHMVTPYVQIDLMPYPEELPTYSYFAPVKHIKVAGGTSKTKVQNVAAPFITQLLGFDYTETVEPVVTGDMQMLYTNITEVIAAHPQKDYRWINQRKYEIVSPETLESVMEKFYLYDGVIAIDTETTGLNITYLSRTGQGDQLTGICLSMTPGEAYYFPLQMRNMPNLCDGDHFYFMDRYMRRFLETHQFVTHNNQFDWKVFYIYDINLNVVFDTMIAYAVTEKLKNATFEIGLKALTHNILNMDQLELDDFVKNGDWSTAGITFADLPADLCRYYAPTDADMTLSLYNVIIQSKLIESYGAETILNLEVKFSKLAAYSEFWGYHVNVAGIPEMERTTQEGLDKLYAQMVEIVKHDFNPSSPKQLLTILYDELKYPVVGGGKPSTNKETLKELSEITDIDDKPLYPLAKLLVEYRKLNGIKSNFLKRRNEYLSVDDTIFPSVKPLGARTGRCSVTEPNYQSYNDVVKKNITPRKGFKMWDCDFSQIEYRTLSSMAKEQSLIDAFADPDMDYHTLQASRMFKVPYAAVTGDIRQQAKRINFALPYGMGDESLGANIFGKRCKENTVKAAELRDLYFEGQDNVRNFFDVVRADGVKNGYTTTLFGRKRFYSRGNASVNVIRRQAGNAVIQGCQRGDTLIQTKELGIVKIEDVVGLSPKVWNGKKWTNSDIVYSGKKRKCIVRFNTGQEFVCSPIHKFLVRSYTGNERFVECKDLISKKNSQRPHRVVITQEYVPSDWKYDSDTVCNDYVSGIVKEKNIVLDNVSDSYKIGVELSRTLSVGQINQSVFKDTELLRGFLCGMFDLYGSVTDKTICITLGNGINFVKVCNAIQKALLLFGIRTSTYKYRTCMSVAVETYDNARFMHLIGFVSKDKIEKAAKLTIEKETSVFERCVTVESVEITDEYIDMYDVCNTEDGYYVADGVITHNTAADIYKIACVRVFDMICAKGWLGKVLLVAFVHDEILGEVSEEINFDEFITCWRQAFEVPIEGFCKLFAGFGIGNSWYQAKKQDLHPLFLQELIDTAPTRTWTGNGTAYIDDVIVKGFVKHKIRRVREYITSAQAQGDIIKPIINTYLIEYTTEFLARWVEADKAQCVEIVGKILNRSITDKQVQALNDKKLAKTEDVMGITSLQDWLKIYCFWQQVDYNSIDIKAPGDIKQVSTVANVEEQIVSDTVAITENTEEYITQMVKAFGLYLDEVNALCYVNASIFDKQHAQYFMQTYYKNKGAFRVILCAVKDAEIQRVETPYYVNGADWVNMQIFISAMLQQMYSEGC